MLFLLTVMVVAVVVMAYCYMASPQVQSAPETCCRALGRVSGVVVVVTAAVVAGICLLLRGL